MLSFTRAVGETTRRAAEMSVVAPDFPDASGYWPVSLCIHRLGSTRHSKKLLLVNRLATTPTSWPDVSLDFLFVNPRM